jgi:hypothetical protein
MRKTKLMLSLSALGSSLVLSASLAVPATAASGRPAPGPPALLSGQVLNARGNAVPGAMLVLLAWPGSWENSSGTHHRGDKVPTVLIARTTTDSSGRYSVGALSERAFALATSAASHGIVNFKLEVAAAYGSTEYSFPRRLEATSTGPQLAALFNPPGGPGLGPQTVTIRLSRTHPGPYHPSIVCVPDTFWVKNYRERWEPFGATYSTTSHVRQGFSYSNGQSTSFSVGVSATGAKGTFSTSGSFTKSNSHATSETPPSSKGPASRVYETHVINGLYVFSWSDQDCGPSHLFTQPDNLPGGGRTIKGKAPRATRCESYGPRYKFSKSVTKAATFTRGYSIPAIGFTASTQTGWSSEATVWYNLGHKRKRICGTNAKPGNDPRILVARAPRK